MSHWDDKAHELAKALTVAESGSQLEHDILAEALAGNAIELTQYVVCGWNPEFSPETMGGCAKKMPIAEAYRCVDCNVYFHKGCIKVHWERRLTEADIERECRGSTGEKS